MAVFEYQCRKCGLQQEKLFRKEPPDCIECPDCKEDAHRQLSDFGFQFADGKVPGNTGVYSLDTSVDKRVGRDANSRWEVVKDRSSAKAKALHGTESGRVGLTADGEYVPLSSKKTEYRAALHEVHQAAQEEGAVADLSEAEFTAEKAARKATIRKVE